MIWAEIGLARRARPGGANAADALRAATTATAASRTEPVNGKLEHVRGHDEVSTG